MEYTETQLQLKDLPADYQKLFHTSQMQRVRKEVKDVTFISHTQHKGNYFIEVRIKNSKGGKDVVNFPLQVPPNQITDAEYNFIITTLKEKSYGTTV